MDIVAPILAGVAAIGVAVLAFWAHVAFQHGKLRLLASENGSYQPFGYGLLPMGLFVLTLGVSLVAVGLGADMGDGPGLFLLAPAILAEAIWMVVRGTVKPPDRIKPDWVRRRDAGLPPIDGKAYEPAPLRPVTRVALCAVIIVTTLYVATFHF